MNLLSIGGSDPSSGAGIQSDIKAFSSFGVHGLTVITAITSQNTTSFGIVEPASQKILRDQLDSITSDFKIDGIKIGMVHNSQTMKVLYSKLKKMRVPIVVDPVIKSTTGGDLIKRSDIADFQKYIVPLATVITPNKSEAEVLAKNKINSKNTLEKTAKAIQIMGAKNVAITGIEKKNGKISDFVLEKNKKYFISGDKIDSINHGSGCSYSASVIFQLAKNKSIRESLVFAKQSTYDSIKNAKNPGKGISITSVQKQNDIIMDLKRAIAEFTEIKDIYKNIPECQTNFVYSKEKPKSMKDVLGISGRIVKAGRQALLAGDVSYGGSKHVAAALLTINKKFPQVCSAINLKYQNTTMSKIKKLQMAVSRYDRTQEPSSTKLKRSTIKWGIKNAIKDSKSAPDIIFHMGDFGKEPMILVFGKNPKDVLKKVLRIV